MIRCSSRKHLTICLLTMVAFSSACFDREDNCKQHNGGPNGIFCQLFKSAERSKQEENERNRKDAEAKRQWSESRKVDWAKEAEKGQAKEEAERAQRAAGKKAVEEFQKRKNQLIADWDEWRDLPKEQPERTDNRRPPKPLSPTPQKISDYAIKSIELYNQGTANGDDYAIQQAKAMMDAIALADRVPECDGCSDDNLWTYQWEKTNRYVNRAKRIYDYATNSPEIADHNKAKHPNRYESILNIEAFEVDSAVSAEAAIVTRALIQKVIRERRNEAGRTLGGFSITQALSNAKQGLFYAAYQYLDIAWDAVDIAVGTMPGIGDVKEFCEAVTGWRFCVPDKQALSVSVGTKSAWKYSAKTTAEALETAAQTAGRIALLLKESVETVVKETFGKLNYLGKDGWRSPAGLVYGDDKNFGNRFWHVLSHPEESADTKAIHGVFSDSWQQILPLLDEGWVKRGTGYISNGREVFEIDMQRQIGTNTNENFLRIVLKKDSSEVILAYPISQKDVSKTP